MKTMKNNTKYNKYNQNQVENRSLFLPIMLCSRSSSIKDVKLSHRSLMSTNPSSSPSLVGCTGRQVKRNNRVVGYPPHHTQKLNFTTATSTNTTRKASPQPPEHNHDHCDSNTTSNPMTYQKLRRFFSSRSLVTYAPTGGGGEVGSESGGSRGRREVVVDGGSRMRSKTDVGNDNCNKNSIGFRSCGSTSKLGGVLNIEELDPPLPVIKRVWQQQPSEGNGDSKLWTRRFGGASLQSLQVQSIVHCNNNKLAVPVRTV